MSGVSRRGVVTTGVAAAALAHRANAAAPITALGDASRLESVAIHSAIRVRPRADDSVAGLRRHLQAAIAAGRPVVVGGARHSMGGQSLARNGVEVGFATFPIEVDTRARTYRVSSGALWRDVIAALDRHGLSPKVMQANNDFSVGGTFSVNAHGWPVPFGPMGTTVRSFRIMLADGTILTVDRGHELFALAMGGYGLMGMILDFEVEATPNLWLSPRFEVMPADRFAARFLAVMRGPVAAKMAYGRLSVAAEGFLSRAALVSLHGDEAAPAGHAGSGGGSALSTLTRSIYRAQVGSDAMKRARWYAETEINPKLQPDKVGRNELLNTPATLLEERRADRTDILHEYFVPPDRLADFLHGCRAVIPKSGQDLLNVTLRYVGADPTSVLTFAPQPRIAAVMSFSQRRTAEADRSMRAMTEALVERAIGVGASYYLPYRLHARVDQFRRVYPSWSAFAEAKRRYDPRAVFHHGLWDRYFG